MSLRVADCLYEVLSTDAREGSVSSCLDQVYSELFYRKKMTFLYEGITYIPNIYNKTWKASSHSF